MGELSARAVLVTVAVSGIGRALAEQRARRRVPVVLCDIDVTGVEAAAKQIAGDSGRAWALAADAISSRR